MTRRIGLYTPDKPIRTNEERLELLDQMYPRPQVDLERELGQVAIIKGVLNVKHTSDSNGLSN